MEEKKKSAKKQETTTKKSSDKKPTTKDRAIINEHGIDNVLSFFLTYSPYR